MRILLIAVLVQQVPSIVMSSAYTKAKDLRFSILDGIDAHVRPDNITSVQVGLDLVSVNSLNWEEQVLSATGWLTVVWTSSVTGWTPGSFGEIMLLHFFEGEVWRPDIIMENSVDNIGPVVEEKLHYRVLFDGTTVWEPQVQFKVHCNMDMTYYPFDRHTCSMVISSWSYTVDEMTLSPLNTVVSLDKYLENAVWELSSDPQITTSTETRTVNTESRTYSKLTFEFKLTRRTDIYGLVIFLPLIILNVLSILVFVLPIETGEKSVYCVAILLALILMFTAFYDELPVAKYLPIIAVYAILVVILAALCIVCSVVILYLHHHDTSEPLSPLTVSVGMFLMQITCDWKQDNTGDHGDSWKVSHQSSIEEITGNHVPDSPQNRSKSEEHLPNGNAVLGQMIPRRKLTPIERNRVRPRSDGSRKARVSLNSHSFQDESLDDPITWRGIAKQFNKLCFFIFIALSFLVHFVFIVTLAVGGSNS